MQLITKSAIFALLAFVGSSEGHVRLVYDAASATPVSARNAAAEGSNGKFSVSGPCGGANTFGANGVYDLTNGDKLCATINYNGGHKSNANQFRAKWACDAKGITSQTNFRDMTEIDLAEGSTGVDQAGAGVKTVAAPNGNEVTEGYTLCADIQIDEAASAEGSDGRACTLSIHDQRGWGGCVDVNVLNTPAVPQPTPSPVPNTDNPSLAAGVYTTDPECIECKECCPQGHFAVTEDGRMFSKLTSSKEVSAEGSCVKAKFDQANLAVKQAPVELDILPGTFKSGIDLNPDPVSSQNFEIKLRADKETGAKTLQFNNLATDVPLVCDGTGTYAMSIQDAVSQNIFTFAELGLQEDGTVPGGVTGGTNGATGATDDNTALYIGVGAGVIGVGAAAMYVKNKRGNAAPSALPRTGQMSTSQMGASAWRATQDPNTGKTYYYNSQTGETSWTAPVSY